MQGKSGNTGRLPGIAVCTAGILLLITVVWFSRRADRGILAERTAISSSETAADSAIESKHDALDSSQLVSSSQCAGCHAEISAAYQLHPMAHSISRVTTLPAGSEDASLTVPGRTRQYEVVMRDGKMFHQDEMCDAEGQVIFEQSVEMDYAVGSGRRAFAYLSQQGDLMFQSPLNWYSQAAKWDLSPGYRPDDERRFRRRITDDCLSCHAGRVASVENMPNRYQQPAFLEMSIGCEKCHGPGKPHIDFHQSQVRVAGGTDPIVNPGHLGIVQRESVCNQCHLQSVARIPRYGHSEFDFRPGQKFEENWTAFDAGTDIGEDGRTRAVNHVQQMRDSRSDVDSKQSLGCISCHDPHRLPAEHEKDSWYRQKCLECHKSDDCTESPLLRQEQADSCIACHMPHRDSNNISHVTQTDHRILRKAIDAAVSEKKENPQLRFFDGAHERMETWEQNRAMGIAIFSFLSKKGQKSPPELLTYLESALVVHPADGLALSALGALALQHGRTELAVRYLTRAQDVPLAEEAAVSGLLDIFYRQARWEESLKYVDRCLELDPGHSGYHAIRADALMNSGRLREGIVAAETSIALDPTRIEVRLWLASAYEKDAGISDATAMREIVRRMQTAALPEPLGSDAK